MVKLSIRYLRLGVGRSHLDSRPVLHLPRISREPTVNENSDSFRCGKHVAHCRTGAATTTAGLEIAFQGRRPTRQCFAVCNPARRLASNGVRVFERIDKKLTTRAERPNRLEGRVPESDGDRPGLHLLRRRRLTSPLLGTLSQGCKRK